LVQLLQNQADSLDMQRRSEYTMAGLATASARIHFSYNPCQFISNWLFLCFAAKSCTPSHSHKELHNLTQTRSVKVQLNLACLKLVSNFATYTSWPICPSSVVHCCRSATNCQFAVRRWLASHAYLLSK